MKSDLFTPQFEPVRGQATPVSPEMQERVLRGVADIVPREEFERKLASGERMRIYIGADPSRPDLHIGHAVALRSLAAFQELGHEVIFLIGDFTGRIGDPTGKDAARVALTTEQVMENAETYKQQIGKLLDFSEDAPVPARLLFNSQWLSALNFEDVIRLASEFTVQQMLERDMFENRMTEGRPIYVHEFFYPIMQGYDSVAMNVDVEVGGTDQLFNMLAGRTLMKTALGREKTVITFELLPGLDGRKMSKSYDNYVGINDAPNEMYGKLMSLADELIESYWKLCTNKPIEYAEMISRQISENILHPRDAKMALAHEIVSIYHGAELADSAESSFVSQFQKQEKPSTMIEVFIGSPGEYALINLILSVQFASSKSEARRLIEQGGVSVDDNKITNPAAMVLLESGHDIKVGKRRWARMIVK